MKKPRKHPAKKAQAVKKAFKKPPVQGGSNPPAEEGRTVRPPMWADYSGNCGCGVRALVLAWDGDPVWPGIDRVDRAMRTSVATGLVMGALRRGRVLESCSMVKAGRVSPDLTLDGAVVVPDEARALGERLLAASRSALRNEHRAQITAAEAAFRLEPGAVEYVDHLGRPAVGRLGVNPHGVHIVRPGAPPAGLGYAARWPETVRLRTYGGRVAHLWRGTGQALCGLWLHRPMFAPDDMRTCPACAAKEGT